MPASRESVATMIEAAFKEVPAVDTKLIDACACLMERDELRALAPLSWKTLDEPFLRRNYALSVENGPEVFRRLFPAYLRFVVRLEGAETGDVIEDFVCSKLTWARLFDDGAWAELRRQQQAALVAAFRFLKADREPGREAQSEWISSFLQRVGEPDNNP